jgi:3-methyladenine DNA glycosylase/8-oxoguanine DNA glycosylase
MAKSLCVLQSELANGLISKQYCCENLAEEPSKKRRLKRKKATQKQSNKLINKNPENCSDSQDRAMGNFPSSKEIACLDESFLKRHCNLGYRAENIVRLARDVESGKVKLEEVFESETIYKEMMKIKGFGPFACATLMMCVGFYQVVPVDSETVRHLEEFHGRKVPDKVGMRKKLEIVQQHVKDIYEKYAPFQSLAYWYASFNLQNNAFFHYRSLIITRKTSLNPFELSLHL